MQKACHEESHAFCLRRIAAKRRKGYNSLFGTQRRKTPRTFRCPGCSISQSVHTWITRIEVRPCICSANRNFLKHFYLIYLQNVFYPFQGYFYYIFCFRGIRFYNMIYRIIIFWSFLSYNQNRYLHSFKLFTITGNGKSTIYFSIFMALTMIISGISLLK